MRDLSPPDRRRVLCTPDAKTRLAAATQWLAERGGSNELVVVGATMQAAADLVRVAGRDLGAAFGWHRFTLAQFAWALADAQLSDRGLLPAGALALEAICARVVHAASARGALGR